MTEDEALEWLEETLTEGAKPKTAARPAVAAKAAAKPAAKKAPAKKTAAAA